jgi:cbb3-type cytochrome oxidase subunit 3
MFSQGQLVFAGFFFIVFVIAMIYAYRKDVKLHNLFYKGSYKVLIAFAVFIGLLFVIKVFFKR